ncbi:O-antigen ligase family protein [Micavibrio aeruginosavorus]|uniref:O-antigen ligase family protein n=1 Tax=Micavibrio aeruginosavorus TaxID=349221 RepID=UPI003F4A89C2
MMIPSFLKSFPAGQAAPLSQRQTIILLVALALVLLTASLLPRTLSAMPLVLGLAPALLWAGWNRAVPPLYPAALICTGAIVALAACSTLWALDPAEAGARAGKIAMVLIPGAVMLGFCRGADRDTLNRIAKIIPLAVMAGWAVIIGDYYTGQPLYRLTHDIAADVIIGTYETNRACMALTLCSLPAMVMALRLWPGILGWGMAAAIIGLGFAAIDTSDSQTALLAFIIGIAVLAAFPVVSIWPRRVLKWVLLAGIATGPFLAIAMFRHLATALEPMFLDSSANPLERMEIWDFVSRYALQNPLTGFGIEASRVITDFDNAKIYEPASTIMHPHNGVLQIWIEFGALGAALTMAAVAALFRRIDALTPANRRLVLAVFLAACSVGLTGYGLWQGWWLGVCVLMAALTALTLKIRPAPVRFPLPFNRPAWLSPTA